MTDYIKSLQDVILDLHGCESDHLESTLVTEEFRGQVVWDGIVESFSLVNHKQATHCYAWSHAEGDGGKDRRYVAVL